MLYFHNLSQKSIILEWIDFEGKPRQSRTLRHRDHTEISSFVGHAWQIKDYETGMISPLQSPAREPKLSNHFEIKYQE